MLKIKRIKIIAFMIAVSFCSYTFSAGSEKAHSEVDVNHKLMAADVLLQVLPVNHTMRHAWTAGYCYYNNKNQNDIIDRDALIQAVVLTNLEHFLEKLLYGRQIGTGLTISRYSAEAAERFDRLYKPFEPQNGNEFNAASIREKALLVLDRTMRIETSANLHITALPHNIVHMVEGVITKYMAQTADKAKITQKQINIIAKATHNFVTEQAPEYIKKSYQELISGSKDLYQYFSGKVRNSAASVASAARIALNRDISPQLKKELGAFNNRIDGLLATQQELVKLEAAHAKREEIHVVQARLEREQKAFHAIGSDLTQGFSQIAHMAGDHRTANLVQSFGSGAVKIVDNLMLLNNAHALEALNCAAGSTSSALTIATGVGAAAGGASGALTTLSAVQPWIGIGVGILTIASAIMDANAEEQPNGFDIILEEMGKLSHKLDVYHQQTMHGLRILDQHLDAQDRMLFQNFFALHQDSKNIKQGLAKIYDTVTQHYSSLQGSLSNMHNSLRENHQIIAGDLQSLRTESIQELIDESLYAIKDPRLSREKFQEYITKLIIKACNRAKEPYLTGGAIDTQSNSALLTALDRPVDLTNIWNHAAFAHVNLIKNWVEQNITKIKKEPLVNPLIWIKCAETILELLHKKIEKKQDYLYDDETRKQDLEKLMSLYYEGSKLVNFFDSNQICGIASCVKKTLDELSTEIKTLVDESESIRLKESCKSVADCLESEIVEIQAKAGHICSCASLLASGTASIFGPQLGILGDGDEKNRLITIRNEISSQGQIDISGDLDKLKASVIKKIGQVKSHNRDMFQTKIAYPKDRETYQIVLLLPENEIPACAEYCEYSLEPEQPNSKILYFHLRAYIADSNGCKRLIYHKRKVYERSTLYKETENLVHYWYGGKYPKEADLYAGTIWGVMWRFKKHDTNVSGFVAPKVPYCAARDTWMKDAEIMPLPEQTELENLNLFQNNQKKINGLICEYLGNNNTHEYIAIQKQALERRKFTGKLLTLTVASDSSLLFKILEKLDGQFKILQSLAALIYNESMYVRGQMLPEFRALFTEQARLLSTSKALINYLTEYAQENNPAAEESFELLQMLQQTKDKIQEIVTTILRNFRPSFNRNQVVLANLAALMRKYQAVIEFRELEKMHLFSGGATSHNVHSIIAGYLAGDEQATSLVTASSANGKYIAVSDDARDKKIDELISSNKKLTESNTKLETQVSGLTTQLSVLSTQVSQLLALLAAKK